MSNTATDPTSEFGQGVEAARTPEQLRQEQAAINAANTGQNGNVIPMQTTSTQKVWTQEEVDAERERVRQEERSKLHPKIDQVDVIRAELDEMKAERQRIADEAAAETARLQAEAEAANVEKMTLTQRIEHLDKTWSERFDNERKARETAEAITEQERRFSALAEFKTAQLRANEDAIVPAVAVFVGGNSEEEILASIELAKQQSAEIIDAMRQTQQQQWTGLRGTSPTGMATTGPLENMPSTQSFSPADIAAMTPAEYAKHRGSLLRASSQQFHQGR